MKNRIKSTMLLSVIAVAMTAMSAFSQNFTISRHMGATLNTAVNENDATLAPNGLSLYFSSTRKDLGGFGGLDIYVSRRATLGSVWGAPQNLGATVNTSNGERIACFSLDGREMFLVSDRPGLGFRDLYLSTRQNANDDLGWTTPVNLGPVINTELDELPASYFEDQATGDNSLIFSSNRQNGGVDYDLFQSTRNGNGTFNTPVAINELNSIGAEIRTAVRRDGLEIFIGASRPGGMAFGLFDIWVSTRTSVSAPWNPPVLLPNINTTEDENNPSLSPDGSILYFTANRNGGVAGLDLYSATRCSLYSASQSPSARFRCF